MPAAELLQDSARHESYSYQGEQGLAYKQESGPSNWTRHIPIRYTLAGRDVLYHRRRMLCEMMLHLIRRVQLCGGAYPCGPPRMNCAQQLRPRNELRLQIEEYSTHCYNATTLIQER